jgi:hypothetical protein
MIWRYSSVEETLFPEEIILGDTAYVGMNQLLTPYKHLPGQFLTMEQYAFNSAFSHYRARSEQANQRLLKNHGILTTTFRGSWQTLANAVQVLAHTQNMDNRMYLKYQPIGPWSHWGDDEDMEQQ